MLTSELVDMIIKADGGVEYSVPDDTITPELLENGSFLKMATEICNRNRTQLNMIKLLKILRDSWVWIPCSVVMGDADYAALEKLVKDAEQNSGLNSLVGKTLSNQDNISMMFTPKGLSVSARQRRMFSRRESASMPPEPISPSSPALEQAAANSPVAILAMPPCIKGKHTNYPPAGAALADCYLTAAAYLPCGISNRL